MESHLLGNFLSLLKFHNMFNGLETGFLPAVLRKLGDSLLGREKTQNYFSSRHPYI